MSKGTTLRNVRIPDELWGAALQAAQEDHTDVSAAIRWFLAEWVSGNIVLWPVDSNIPDSVI